MTEPLIRFVDVGHGNATIVAANGFCCLIDAGTGSALIRTLEELHIQHLDVVLISHADEDHLAGLVALIEEGNVSVACVRLNGNPTKDSKVWKDLIWLLQDHPTIVVGPSLSTNDKWSLGQLLIEVLAPVPALVLVGVGGRDRQDRRVGTNSLSAVVRVVWDGRPLALLPGDMDDVGLANALEAGVDFRCDVLVYPHHGGGGSASAAGFCGELLKAASPRAVVFSIGRGKYGTPRPDVVKSVRGYGGVNRVLCTQLSEHCASTTPPSGQRHFLGQAARGYQTGRCCAGSVEVKISGSLQLMPLDAEHLEFIKQHAATALCRL